MCGRFALSRASSELAPLFGVEVLGEGLPEPSQDIRPSQPIAVVLESAKTAPARRLEAARWGLVPAFRKSLRDGPTPFNARVEKLLTSGMYRQAAVRRRAIVPADAFFEWRKADKAKFRVERADGRPLALAGLYEWWRRPDAPEDDQARWLLSATIVTRPPQGRMAAIHDRQPLYLADDLWDAWLDPAEQAAAELVAAAMAGSAAVAEQLVFTVE
ncbi:MAG: SOS response-associated peptidase [Propionibacteriaceae bacterium]|nr:SOS response-associated peptidase [Propionibacteriaceae bacterium]